MKSKEGTKQVILQRHTILNEIFQQYRIKGLPLTTIQAISIMKERGFRDYTTQMYFRDKRDLNSQSTFIVDLAKTDYSAYMEEIDLLMQFVQVEALNIYNNTWNNDKTITKQVNTKDEGIVNLTDTHETADIATPKLKALEIMLDVAKLRKELISGDNLNLSAALLGQKYREMRDKINSLKLLVPKKAGRLTVIKK